MISETSKKPKRNITDFQQYRMVAKIFAFYNDLVAHVGEIREELSYMSYSGGTPTGFSGSSHDKYSVHSPVEEDAIKRLSLIPSITFVSTIDGSMNKVYNPELWMFVVGYTLDYFAKANPLVESVLNERYIHGSQRSKILELLKIDKLQFSRAVNLGIGFATAVAAELGLTRFIDLDLTTNEIFVRGVAYQAPWITSILKKK